MYLNCNSKLYIRIFKKNASNSRDLEQMIEAEDTDGIIARQLYAGLYGIYNKQDQQCLLRLAFESNKSKVIKHLKDKIINMERHICTEDLLDVICENAQDFSSDHLECIYKMDPNLTTKDGENAYWTCIHLEKHIGNIIRHDRCIDN